ncbi:MAG: DUF4221 domain-containing protein [Tannerellaceae bacterium]|nr:DUF4221 domain-containing protein [Tannerellaceae bacterium]
MKQFVFLLAGLVLIGCESKPRQNNRIGKAEYTFEKKSNKLFSLDETTTQVGSYIQFDTGKNQLIYLNPGVRNICIFDFDSGKTIEKIEIQKEGPHAVLSGNIKGFYFVNLDSTYLYDYWSKYLILINQKGEIMEKRDLSHFFIPDPDKIDNPPYIYTNTDAPMKIVNSKLILQGTTFQVNLKDYQNPNTTAIYNLFSDEMKFCNPYPSVYGGAENLDKWGFFSYLMPSYDINDSDEMVLSFPADDYIYVVEPEILETNSFFAGYSNNRYIRTSPAPKAQNPQEELAEYLEHTLYAGIFYDPYNQLYYRLVLKSIKDYNPNDESTQVKDISIIILDKDYNKVGEYDLDEKVNVYRNCFVSPVGFHMHIITDDDDHLTYLTFKPVKI